MDSGIMDSVPSKSSFWTSSSKTLLFPVFDLRGHGVDLGLYFSGFIDLHSNHSDVSENSIHDSSGCEEAVAEVSSVLWLISSRTSLQSLSGDTPT